MIAIGMPFDDIGPWSEIKLEIIRKYAAAYSAILTRQRGLHHVYIDAFASADVHVTRSTREYVAGESRQLSARAESLNRGGDQLFPGPGLTP